MAWLEQLNSQAEFPLRLAIGFSYKKVGKKGKDMQRKQDPVNGKNRIKKGKKKRLDIGALKNPAIIF